MPHGRSWVALTMGCAAALAPGLLACGATTSESTSSATTAVPDGRAGSDRDQGGEAERATAAPLRLLDFVVMAEGHGPEERARYLARVAEIARDYGVSLDQTYEVIQIMSGEVQPVTEVSVWSLPNPEALGAVQQDPRYAELAPIRDEIHDMSRLTLYFAEPVVGGDQITASHVLVDLVFLKDGQTLEDRREYSDTIGRIAARHGARRVQSYRIVAHLNGLGEGAVELGLWELDDPSAVQATVNDPEYQQHVERRNEIHDMSRLTMMMARPLPSP